MARAAGKPMPPPYPRPVPSISAEDLQSDPDGVETARRSYESSEYAVGFEVHEEENAESHAQTRAAKRRRIETNATAYLRGQSLHILSAQLRGPFTESWTNPWSRRTLDGRSDCASNEIDADAFKHVRKNLKEADHKRNKQNRIKNIRSEYFDSRDFQKKTQSAIRRNNAPQPQSHAVQPSSVPSRKNRGEVRKVEKWLRTSDAYARDKNESSPQASPTPSKRCIADVQEPRSSEEEEFESLSPGPAPLTAYERIQQLSRKMCEAMENRVGSTVDHHRTISLARHIDVVNPSRAEFAIINARRQIFTTAESFDLQTAENPPISPAGFEHGIDHGGASVSLLGTESKDSPPKVSDQRKCKPPILQHQIAVVSSDSGASNRLGKPHLEDVGDAVAKDSQCLYAHSDSVVSQTSKVCEAMSVQHTLVGPSGTTSEAQTTYLPSAQQPLFEHQVLSDADAVEPGLQPIQPNAVSPVQLIEGASTAEAGLELITNKSVCIVEPDQSIATTSQSTIKVKQQSTTLTTQNTESSVAGSDTSWQAGSMLHTKPSRDKKRKRASFAPEVQTNQRPHHSFKHITKFKVSKSPSTSNVFPMSKGVFTISPHQDNDSESICFASDKSSIDNTSRIAKKGILKSTNMNNSQSSNRNSKYLDSSSQQQDGQGDRFLAAIQPAVLDEGEFDLEAAIQDLGSFLGSWNAEKEASGVGE